MHYHLSLIEARNAAKLQQSQWHRLLKALDQIWKYQQMQTVHLFQSAEAQYQLATGTVAVVFIKISTILVSTATEPQD